MSVTKLSFGVDPATSTIDSTKITLFNEGAFQKADKYITGPSPYATTRLEGPSLKKTTQILESSGKLENTYEFQDVTPHIGREFAEAQLSDILKDEALLRDLAINISRRGVVFFRNQNLTVEEQKILADELGKVTGKPATSGLHIHPTAPAGK